MAVFKRKSSKGETEEYHYRFMQNGRLNYGVCEGCTDERAALKYERKKRALAKAMAERKSDIEDFDKYREQVITGKKQIALADAFDEYMKKPRKREPGQKRLAANRSYFNDFNAFMVANYPDIASVRAVTTKHAEEYINLLKTTGVFSKEIIYTVRSNNPNKKPSERRYISNATSLSAATINARHKQLKSVFDRLKKDIGIVINPFQFYFTESDKNDREVFTKKELDLILKNISMPYTKPVFIIGLCTGLSLSDICLLKWSNIIDDFICTHRRKTGAYLEIPILPPLRAFLTEQYTISGDGDYICPELAQMYLENETGVNTRIKTFLESLGIETAVKLENRSRAVSNKAAHSMRHTFAYMAGCNNVPLAVVQSILGHMDDEMTKMYQRHADRKDKQRFLANLPMALIGDVNTEPERDQLAELSRTLPIKKVKEILNILKKHPKALPENSEPSAMGK